MSAPQRRIRFEIISDGPRDHHWFCGHACPGVCEVCNYDLTRAALGMAQKIDMAVAVLRTVHDYSVIQRNTSLRAETARAILVLSDRE